LIGYGSEGPLRHLFQPAVMEAYLNACGVLIKDFGAFTQKITNQCRTATYRLAEETPTAGAGT